jgi:hypothetical protein
LREENPEHPEEQHEASEESDLSGEPEKPLSQEEDDKPELADEYELKEQNQVDLEQRSGCLRGCLTPILIILAIVAILFIIGYSRRDSIRPYLIKRILNNTQNQVISMLPEDMDEKAVEATFERVKNALREKQLDEEMLIEAIREYQDALPENLPSEERKQEINKLIEGLDEAILDNQQN